MQTLYIQVQDHEHNVILMNGIVGTYKKINHWALKKGHDIASSYPNVKKWQIQCEPYTEKVIM